jgi:hypothetical protein
VVSMAPWRPTRVAKQLSKVSQPSSASSGMLVPSAMPRTWTGVSLLACRCSIGITSPSSQMTSPLHAAHSHLWAGGRAPPCPSLLLHRPAPVLAQAAADGKPIKRQAPHGRHALRPQAQVHAAVNDSVHGLPAAVGQVHLQAALHPAVRPVQAVRQGLWGGVVGRQLVQRQDDVGTQLLLGLDRQLRGQQQPRPIPASACTRVGLEAPPRSGLRLAVPANASTSR